MIDRNRLAGSVVPFCRRWHIIQEVDLARLMAEHGRLAALCDELEACADLLPALPTRERSAALREALGTLAVRDDRAVALYLQDMFTRQQDDPLTCALLDKVRTLHITDAAHAEELIAMLEEVEGRQSAPNEALGYLLRCFFQVCRHTMDVEKLAILHLARGRLTPEARALLTGSLTGGTA